MDIVKVQYRISKSNYSVKRYKQFACGVDRDRQSDILSTGNQSRFSRQKPAAFDREHHLINDPLASWKQHHKPWIPSCWAMPYPV